MATLCVYYINMWSDPAYIVLQLAEWKVGLSWPCPQMCIFIKMCISSWIRLQQAIWCKWLCTPRCSAAGTVTLCVRVCACACAHECVCVFRHVQKVISSHRSSISSFSCIYHSPLVISSFSSYSPLFNQTLFCKGLCTFGINILVVADFDILVSMYLLIWIIASSTPLLKRHASFSSCSPGRIAPGSKLRIFHIL